jgi:hypothetical protein
MDISCKRNIACIVFVFFGVFNIAASDFFHDQTKNEGPLIASIILYVILFSTIVRYYQYITLCQRYCSAISVIICYSMYWSYLCEEIKKSPNDESLHIVLSCSVVTAICDVGVFTSFAYAKNDIPYEPIPLNV